MIFLFAFLSLLAWYVNARTFPSRIANESSGASAVPGDTSNPARENFPRGSK